MHWKKCFKQIPLQVRQREREGERVQHTNEPISFIWKWTKTLLMKTPRPGREGGAGWILIYFFTFVRLWSTHVTVVTQGKVTKVSKGKQIQFYFNLRTGALAGNLNPSLMPRIWANEGDRQNNFCQDILYLAWMWDRSSVRGGTRLHLKRKEITCMYGSKVNKHVEVDWICPCDWSDSFGQWDRKYSTKWNANPLFPPCPPLFF